ncbi:C39 family peptidase, partial [Spiroplasma phoeniceum]|uniref:C39 family peptidase n=1 Tax=Spiroplasma phoeniceum TaxID=47835 RepID=UPI003364CCEE
QTDVPYQITTMYTFTSDGGNRKRGDIYFGTTNGVYLRKAGESTTTKIEGINETIMFIEAYSDNITDSINSVHIIKLNKINTINNTTKTPSLNRRTDNNNNRIINLNSVIQQEDYWCGPAIAEAVLRYFGLQSANNNYNTQTNYQFQRTLTRLMNTQRDGTTMNDWIHGINNIILSNRLNYSRTYSINNFDLGYNDTNTTNRFYNLVYYSLQNNVPVAFMYHGSRRLNEEDHSHFILITGVTNNYNNAIYRYMDPWTGEFGTFNSSDINSFLTPTRMYDDYENPLQYGGQLASFINVNITNWDFKNTHIWFNDHASGGSNCIIPEISPANITTAGVETGLAAIAGGWIPFLGNAGGAVIGFGYWYKNWKEKCQNS